MRHFVSAALRFNASDLLCGAIQFDHGPFSVNVPPNRISEIVNGKRSIAADTALPLGKYFGVSPELWLDLQSDYDLRIAQRTTWPEIEPQIRVRAT